MSGKNKPNGYFMFMQAERKRIQAETKQTPSMQEMASICSESWKKLSAEERARYNTMAKQEKGANVQGRDRHRLDNQGQNIADRQNAAMEVINRRTQEKQQLVKSWEGKDILDVPFYLINFQVLYIDDSVDYFLPQEIGMVRFTLRDGINKHMQYFVDPGDAPQGSLHLALKHSENTHKIPLNFDKAESNFLRLWMHIVRFVVKDPRKDEVPPLFCMTNERQIVESCLDYIHYHSRCGEDNIFTKIYTLEDLVMSLILQSGKVTVKPSETQIQDSLLRNQWDYTSSIRCAFHDEMDCSYCSLAIVRRLSFSIFDMLSNTLDFKLKEQHMPDESSHLKFIVMHPSASTNDRGGRNSNIRRRDKSTSRSPSPDFSVASQDRALSASQVTRVEVALSDSEDDEDTDEIRSTSDQYVLAELRTPNISAMMPPTAGQAFGRGFMLPDSAALSSIRPPPGFGLRPGVTSGALNQPQDFVRPNPQTQTSSVLPSARGRGWGTGRGRGMPPQVRPS